MRKMKSISCKEARVHMADILNQVAFKSKRYTLTRHGSDVAVLISVEEWEKMNKLLEEIEDKEDIRAADEALKKHGNKRGTSLKSMKKKLGI